MEISGCPIHYLNVIPLNYNVNIVEIHLKIVEQQQKDKKVIQLLTHASEMQLLSDDVAFVDTLVERQLAS